MNKRQRIEEELEKLGITNETELNTTIKELKPINIYLMTGDMEGRKAS